MRLKLLIAFALFALPAPAAFGQFPDEKAAEQYKGEPIYINSDSLVGGRDKTVYIGSVSAQQKDIKLFCDKLSAFYDEKSRMLKTITAEGRVKVIRDDLEAKCETLTFINQTRTLICEGNPVIYYGPNMITGTKLTIWLAEESWHMENPKTRARPDSFKESEGAGE